MPSEREWPNIATLDLHSFGFSIKLLSIRVLDTRL
jgi:hypothetical protein